jgi:hypothetical protein
MPDLLTCLFLAAIFIFVMVHVSAIARHYTPAFVITVVIIVALAVGVDKFSAALAWVVKIALGLGVLALIANIATSDD